MTDGSSKSPYGVITFADMPLASNGYTREFGNFSISIEYWDYLVKIDVASFALMYDTTTCCTNRCKQADTSNHPRSNRVRQKKMFLYVPLPNALPRSDDGLLVVR